MPLSPENTRLGKYVSVVSLCSHLFVEYFWNVWCIFHCLLSKTLSAATCVLYSRDETPTVEQTQAFVDVCETFIRRNPLQAIGTFHFMS